MKLSSWLSFLNTPTRRRKSRRRAKSAPFNMGILTRQVELLEQRVLLTVPFLQEIDNVILQAGAPLHIALNANDLDEQVLTFSATTDDPIVSTFIPTGNRSIRMSITEDTQTDPITGDMVFQLFGQRAPRPTARVIELAESNFYDGSIIHRVIDDFVIQGGDPNGNPPGTGGSGLGVFDDNFHPDLQHTSSGILSYAKTAVDDTNDSQFFIVESGATGPPRHLDFNHSVFGFITEGDDIREAISEVAVDGSSRPVVDVIVNSVTVFTDIENGVLMLSATSIPENPVTVTVTVTDEDGDTHQRSFDVTVIADPVNTGPFLHDIPQIQTLVDTQVDFQLVATDVEQDTFFFLDETSLDENLLPVPFRASSNVNYSVDFGTGFTEFTPLNGVTGIEAVLVATAQTSAAIDYQVVPVRIVASAETLNVSAADHPTIDRSDDGNADTFTFRSTGTNFEVLINGVVSHIALLSSIDGLVINGSGDDDLLIIDMSNGNPLPAGGVTFNAGGQTSEDTLQIIGSATSVTHNFTNASDGSVQIDGLTVDYTGLEPIFDNLDAVDRIFTFGDSADNITLGDDGTVGNDVSRIASTTSETVDFVSPTGSLTINTEGGNDTLVGGQLDSQYSASLTINGGGGSDSLDSSSMDVPLTLFGNGSDDTLRGGTANDTLDGGSGDDLLTGKAGDDSVSGQDGSDRLFGSIGDDTLEGGTGDNRIDGQGGTDLLKYTLASADNVDILLTNTALQGVDLDEISNIEAAHLIGGDGDNRIDAKNFSFRVTLEGRDGDDVLIGGIRGDSLVGGNGDDKHFGGIGGDTMTGGLGNDTLRGQGSNDRLIESGDVDFTLTDGQLIGLGTDSISDTEKIVLTTGAGNNTIDASGHSGKSTLNGGGGDDTITGGSGNDFIFGGDGDDELSGGAGVDKLFGEDGNDDLNGDAGNDQLTGGLGNDTLDGGDDTDKIKEEEDVDYTITDTQIIGPGTNTYTNVEKLNIKAGPGDNVLDATAHTGVLILQGREGNDTLIGGSGLDTLNGNGGDDVLFGNAGNDRLNGGGNDDTLQGDDGDDTLAGKGGEDLVVESGNVDFTLSATHLLGRGNDRVTDVESIHLTGGGGANILDVSVFAGDATLIGGGGNDSLIGGSGNDLLEAGNGNDTLIGNAGNDILFGNDGSDTLMGGDGDDNLLGGNDDDSISGGDGTDTGSGGAGTDAIDSDVEVDGLFGTVTPGDFDDSGLLGIRTDLVPGAPAITANHVDGDIDYSEHSNPPTYGDHHPFDPNDLDGNPGETPRTTGVYDEEQPEEDLIHNLEHGHVWISYNPNLISNSERSILEQFVRDGSFNNDGSGVGVILTPRADTDSKIAVVSWAHLLTLDSLDLNAIRSFVETNRGHAPEGFITP